MGRLRRDFSVGPLPVPHASPLARARMILRISAFTRLWYRNTVIIPRSAKQAGVNETKYTIHVRTPFIHLSGIL